MAQWTLTDNTGGGSTATFTINPNTATYPGRKASIQHQQTTNGTTILFQGRDEIPTFKFSGLVRDQTLHDLLDTWKDKWYPLVLTDDVGNSWDVIIQSWTWERLRRAGTNWRFDYTAELLVL